MDPAPARRSPQHGLALFLCCAAPIALVALGVWLAPDPRGFGTHEQLGFQPCYPMEHWNLPCPGCGVTTAVSLAVRGRLLASLATQPFALVLLGTSAVGAVWALGEHVRGRDLALSLLALPWRRLLGILLSLALLAWAYKIAAVRAGA